ncbi:MAG: pseudouridine synthase [Lachnospiraceae bacterium]
MSQRKEIRINKLLSEAGICSRREADRQIEAGNVLIDGNTAECGSKVMEGQTVTYQGKVVIPKEEPVLLVFNKPIGVVCTSDKREKDNIIDYINYPSRIYPIGRLDKDSHGLILLTNQGAIVNKIMRSGNHHEKEYIVTVNKPVSETFLKGMESGVFLKELDVVTRKCKVEKISKFRFKIILTQGYNRQIRRMCSFFTYSVIDLKRTRVMNIELHDLRDGTYRLVTTDEWQHLIEQISESSNLPVQQRDKEC